jgi:hypothetical protein
VLSNPSLDLACAWGAAYYGWLRHSGGKRIGGGIPRSYYIGIEAGDEARSRNAVLCVVPRHLEEGEEVNLPKPELELALGEPVLFPLYTSTVRGDDKPGDLLNVSPDQLLQLPPLHTILRGGKRSGVKRVPVHLAAKSTEIGTLELYCVSKEGDNRWRLEFNVRDIVKDNPDPGESKDEGIKDVCPKRKCRPPSRSCARSTSVPMPMPRTSRRSISFWRRSTSRSNWPMACAGGCGRFSKNCPWTAAGRFGICTAGIIWSATACGRVRRFARPLSHRTTLEDRRQSAQEPFDFATAGGKWADYWIMWRRLAGGLNQSYQNTLFNRLRPILLPAKGSRWSSRARMNFGNVASGRGDGAARRQSKQRSATCSEAGNEEPVPTHSFWAMTRVRARALYGPMNTIVHPQMWKTGWNRCSSSHRATTANATPGPSACRNWPGRAASGPRHQRRPSRFALAVLKKLSIPAAWVKMVEEVVEMEGAEQPDVRRIAADRVEAGGG